MSKYVIVKLDEYTLAIYERFPGSDPDYYEHQVATTHSYSDALRILEGIRKK